MEIPKNQEGDSILDEAESKNADEEIAEIKEKLEKQDFQKMVAMAEKDLEELQGDNYEMLKNLFTNVKEKYEVALSVPESANEFRDPHLYKAEEIWKYS